MRALFKSSLLAVMAGASLFAAMEQTAAANASARATVTEITANRVTEVRAIMDEGNAWALSHQSVDRVIERIKKSGFNVFIPCVWHGDGVRFASAVGPPESRLLPQLANGFDPLKYLIERAHANGIEVHPWFTVVLRQKDFLPEFYDKGTPDQAFEIHNEKFRDFMVRLITEVATRYDIDGINLDYMRSMGICESTRCRDNYKNTTGRNLALDWKIYRMSSDARDGIRRWNTAAVTDIVERVARAVRKIKPAAVISVDGRPLDDEPRLTGRNTLEWIEAGWVDLVFYTDYRPVLDVMAINETRAQMKNPHAFAIMMGNFETDSNKGKGNGYPRDARTVSQLVEQARHHWPGVPLGIYLYNQLSDEQIEALALGPFNQTVAPDWSRVRARTGTP